MRNKFLQFAIATSAWTITAIIVQIACCTTLKKRRTWEQSVAIIFASVCTPPSCSWPHRTHAQWLHAMVRHFCVSIAVLGVNTTHKSHCCILIQTKRPETTKSPAIWLVCYVCHTSAEGFMTAGHCKLLSSCSCALPLAGLIPLEILTPQKTQKFSCDIWSQVPLKVYRLLRAVWSHGLEHSLHLTQNLASQMSLNKC